MDRDDHDWEDWGPDGQYDSEDADPAGRQPSPRAHTSVQYGASPTDGYPAWNIVADCSHCGEQVVEATNEDMEMQLQESPTNCRPQTHMIAPPGHTCRGTVVCRPCASTKQTSMQSIAQYANWVDEVHKWFGDTPTRQERCYEAHAYE